MDMPVWSFNETRSLEIELNGTRLDSRQVGTDSQTVHLSLDLKPGQNRLTLKIGGRAIRPSDLAPGPDTRPLTLGVGQIVFPTIAGKM
jgi:hypothetical protein